MQRIRLWGLFAVGIFSVMLGFYSIYLQHARQGWPITQARVLSVRYLDKSRHGPQEDHYQLEVSYRIYDSDVNARMDNYGQPRFKTGDTIAVKVDPGNVRHFIFHQVDGRSSIAAMFLIGVLAAGSASFFLFGRKKLN